MAKRKNPRVTKPKYEPGTQKGPGRPKEIVNDEATRQTIRTLAGLQCTYEDAAAVLGINKSTFTRFINSSEELKDLWLEGMAHGRASLRKNQFEMSKNNPTMAIWLGKQYLGQTDQLALTGKGGGPIETKNDDFAALARALDGIAASRAGGSRAPSIVAGESAALPAPTD